MSRFEGAELWRSTEAALLCSPGTGTSSSLSLFSLCIRLNVKGLGSPGITFLLPLRPSKPALECGRVGSLFFSSAGFGALVDDGGGSCSSFFSQAPIF